MGDGHGNAAHLVLLGGCSTIGRAVSEALLARRPGYTTVTLTSRREPAVPLRGAAWCRHVPLDLTERPERIVAALETLDADQPIDALILAAGTLGGPEQDLLEDPAAVAELLTVNTVGSIAALAATHRLMRRRGRGEIIVCSSLAAVRVRAANRAYGTSKLTLDRYACSLARHDRTVAVHVVRLGAVDTPMTAQVTGRRKAPVAVVAGQVVAGLRPGGGVLYAPRWHAAVAGLLRVLPVRVVDRVR